MTQRGRIERLFLRTWKRTCWVNALFEADCAEAACSRCCSESHVWERFINWRLNAIKLKYEQLRLQQQLPHAVAVPATPSLLRRFAEGWSTAVCGAVIKQMFPRRTETSQLVRGFNHTARVGRCNRILGGSVGVKNSFYRRVWRWDRWADLRTGRWEKKKKKLLFVKDEIIVTKSSVLLLEPPFVNKSQPHMHPELEGCGWSALV